jgi:GTP-binding protein
LRFLRKVERFAAAVRRGDRLTGVPTRQVEAINTLARRTRLAFVSKTPGRTHLINFFRLVNGAFLVDLPGYGYADVPEEIRRQWQGVLAAYLTRRTSICGMVLIMDARRPLTDLDRQMLEWFGPTGKPITSC